MSNGNGHRWSKFWWQDHQGDAALRACTMAARGYWLEMLCVMHAATPVGHLLLNGRRPTDRQMASICGCTEKEARAWTIELEAAGVFSREADGTIWCRRMVRDACASDEGRKWGRKGGNPNLNPKGEGLTPPDKPKRPNGVNPPGLGRGLNKKLEAEAEAEEEPPNPHAVGAGTPASPGAPPRRAEGTNLRAEGTNPRKNGTNPRNAEIPWRSGALEVIYNEGLATKDAEELAKFNDFVAEKGLRYGNT